MTDAIATRDTLTAGERLDWLRLIRSENVGPIVFHQLLRHFGSAGEALAGLPELARRGGAGRTVKVCPADRAERELAAAEAAGARTLASCETAYPRRLAALPDPPPMVYVKGDPVHLAPAAVALVGARNASASGRRYSRDLARALGQAGLIVVSGLARGIDTAAHQGALDSGTVAVLAGGVDVVYPSENQALYEAIAAAGAVLSEMPPGTTPRARHFPRRNRLISGLALGVVVIEAAERSGSLITARFALEQGREVFAVPGSPLDPRCRGGNRLIKQGAQLVQDPEDVLEAIRPMVEQPIPREAASSVGEHPIEPSPSAAGRDRLLGLLGPTPVDIDELIRLAELTPAGTITMLLELELAGRLERHPGNRVSLS
ncbi:MAG: DNA-processing protein DprA [Alphaproteobacteria bacterium]|nr:DNA-processing protein DprA [Alphaproteobacteria bacterium]MDP6813593.1 DNA-processing protein DprA [Alphaproteobacteria bacterium]